MGYTQSIVHALTQKKNVFFAVALRDMRTRFFNHGLGFLVVVLWPVVHMVILLSIYSFSGRIAPFGDSLLIFIASGLVPALLFNYVSRYMSLSLILNRPLMSFPVVHVMDVMLARAFLETIASSLTLLIMMVGLTALGENPIPFDPEQAILAYLATLLLGVGIGSIVGIITMLQPFMATGYALFLIITYLTSGILFVPSDMPASVINIISWNPVMHSVEWMRTAYFPSYSDKILDKNYLIQFGICSLCIGLLLEKALKRKILEG